MILIERFFTNLAQLLVISATVLAANTAFFKTVSGLQMLFFTPVGPGLLIILFIWAAYLTAKGESPD